MTEKEQEILEQYLKDLQRKRIIIALIIVCVIIIGGASARKYLVANNEEITTNEISMQNEVTNETSNNTKEENTTNNIMEITSVIKGLQYIKKYTNEVEILTDSLYVINTMTKGWKRNKNQELWNQLDEELKNFTNIKWTWVKGHSDDLYNNICDELAVQARISKICY